MSLKIRSGRRYRNATVSEVMEAAAEYVAQQIIGTQPLRNPVETRDYLRRALAGRSYEVFCCLYLDNRHRVLAFEELFRGTIDGASVHPREVVKRALANNAAAVILAHNHPSGVAEPSQADEFITQRLKEALALIDVRVLDHLVEARDGVASFAERGLL